jgi:hypothetical protein
MSEVRLDFGMPVEDGAGTLGQLTRVLIDPVQLTARQVVVMPDDLAVTARLVPIEVVAARAGVLVLDCTRERFTDFENAVDYETSPASPAAEVAQAVRIGGVIDAIVTSGPATSGRDRVPEGLVVLERLQSVLASDARVGELDGVVLDLAAFAIGGIIVVEGHLWSKKKVRLPPSAVVAFADVVRLGISAAEAEELAEPVD